MDTRITIATTGTATIKASGRTIVLDAETVEGLAHALAEMQATDRAQVVRGGRVLVVPREQSRG